MYTFGLLQLDKLMIFVLTSTSYYLLNEDVQLMNDCVSTTSIAIGMNV